jgi:hypothetical protein
MPNSLNFTMYCFDVPIGKPGMLQAVTVVSAGIRCVKIDVFVGKIDTNLASPFVRCFRGGG